MAFARPAWILLLVSGVACSHTSAARVPNAATVAADRGEPTRAAAEPAAVVADATVSAAEPQNATSAEQRAQGELALQARNDREQKAYQIAQLRRAVGLYRQFLERAGQDPEYALAVRRSREQIEDAQAIIQLLEQPPEQGP